MTFETLAGVLGGLGLFFGGMLLLSESLKMLTSIRLRILAASWAGSPFTALGWGAFAGFITQSMTSLTFLTVGMRQSGLITPRGALSILLGGEYRHVNPRSNRFAGYQVSRPAYPRNYRLCHGQRLAEPVPTPHHSAVWGSDADIRPDSDEGVGGAAGQRGLVQQKSWTG